MGILKKLQDFSENTCENRSIQIINCCVCKICRKLVPFVPLKFDCHEASQLNVLLCLIISNNRFRILIVSKLLF